MKTTRRQLKRLILQEMRSLNEIRAINESKVFDAVRTIKSAAQPLQFESSGTSKSQQGVANIIEKFASYLALEEVTDEDIAKMKSYLESVLSRIRQQ